MSESNGKVCCNCRHCIRRYREDGRCICYCEIDNVYLGDMTVMENWCRHWAKEQKNDKRRSNRNSVGYEGGI